MLVKKNHKKTVYNDNMTWCYFGMSKRHIACKKQHVNLCNSDKVTAVETSHFMHYQAMDMSRYDAAGYIFDCSRIY